jgi:hypothetical protein
MYIFFYELTILFLIFLASSMFCQWNVYCSSKGTAVNICGLVEHICIILNTRQMLVQRLLLLSVRLKHRLLARSQCASNRSCGRKTQSSFSVVYLGLTADSELLGKLHTELHSSLTAPSILISSFFSSQNSRFKIETKRSNYFLWCTFQCGLG